LSHYLVRRLLALPLTLLAVALITFALAHATPGGPWDRFDEKPLPLQAEINLNRYYGLDLPVHEQFLVYIGNLVRLDLGTSIQKGRPVADIIGEGLPVTAQLGLQSLLLALAVAIPLGVVSALRRNSLADHATTLLATVGTTIPNFVLCVFFILYFGMTLRLLPFVGWGDGLDVRRMLMPTVILALPAMGFLTRLVRSSVLEVLRADFVRTARAKGLRERSVLRGHVLKNAFVPVLTVLGPATANLVVGSFIVETFFSIPGVGRLFIQSVNARDYPVIMATTLLYALAIGVANLAVDLAYGALDPRVKVAQ